MSKARELAELGAVYDSGALSNRNLLINGAMQVNQRGTQTVNASATTGYGPDRFRLNAGGGIDEFVGTIAQDSDVPSGSGFSNSLKITTTTAENAISAGEYIYLHQTIEAQNLQQLAYGTSSAKKVTLSFWVKSTITGTFAVGLYKPDSTSQIHNKTYTINSASTWEYKTITYEANTLSGGAIANDNGAGIEVAWHLAVGSTYKGTDTSSGWANYAAATWGTGQGTDAVITTTNATFQITGVQLELGTEATPFEHRSFGQELALCQRYYQDNDASTMGIGSAYAANAWNYKRVIQFGIMRATPSVAYDNGTAGTWQSGSSDYGVGPKTSAFSHLYSKSSGAILDIYIGTGGIQFRLDAEL